MYVFKGSAREGSVASLTHPCGEKELGEKTARKAVFLDTRQAGSVWQHHLGKTSLPSGTVRPFQVE